MSIERGTNAANDTAATINASSCPRSNPRLQTNQLDILAVDEALQQLAARDPRAAELVKLRFFAGFTVAEAAEALGVSVATAENDWAYAKSWLKLQLSTNEGTRP